MNFQSKVLESAAVLADRASAMATATASRVRERAIHATGEVDLRNTFALLTTAGGELRKIARQHGSRFVKQNASIAKAAGKDLSDLGRAVISNFSGPAKSAPRSARKPVARKRSARKTA